MSEISGVGTDFDWVKIAMIAKDKTQVARHDCSTWSHDNRQGLLEYWTARVAYEMLKNGIEKQVEVARKYQQELQQQRVHTIFDVPEKETPVSETTDEDDDDDDARLTMEDFRNGSDNEFLSLESEEWRTYVWVKEGFPIEVTINDPVCLHVSAAGGHRILDGSGVSHYVPKGWVEVKWEVREGMNHFDF